MKLLKSAVVAASLALSLGSFSTTAVACEDGRTCYGPEQAIDIVSGHIGEAIKALDAKEGSHEILMHIKAAKDGSKEINANDKVDVARGRAVQHLKKARSAIKKGEMQEGEDHLGQAEKGFARLKTLL